MNNHKNLNVCNAKHITGQICPLFICKTCDVITNTLGHILLVITEYHIMLNTNKKVSIRTSRTNAKLNCRHKQYAKKKRCQYRVWKGERHPPVAGERSYRQSVTSPYINLRYRIYNQWYTVIMPDKETTYRHTVGYISCRKLFNWLTRGLHFNLT